MAWFIMVSFLLMILLIGALVGITVADGLNRKIIKEYEKQDELCRKTIQLHQNLLKDSLDEIQTLKAKNELKNDITLGDITNSEFDVRKFLFADFPDWALEQFQADGDVEALRKNAFIYVRFDKLNEKILPISILKTKEERTNQ